MKNIFINSFGIHCSLGYGKQAVLKNLILGQSVPAEHADLVTGDKTFFRPVAEEPKLPEILDLKYQSRNNRVALSVLVQIEDRVKEAIQKYGAERVGVVVATSTTGVSGFEELVFQSEGQIYSDQYEFSTQESGNLSQFVKKHFSLKSVAYTISTACSSGGKVFAEAERLIKSGICDAVIVGGCDTRSELTLNGFSCLSAISNEACKPFEADRSGINIGEGAAFFLLSLESSDLKLSGVGESSDAYHISSPEPSGAGAELAIRSALDQASKSAQDIDYVNLHGTGTIKNDAMESILVERVFGSETPVSTTKHLVGHTLGAAGAIEMALCLLCLEGQSGFLPFQNWSGERCEEAKSLNFVQKNQKYPLKSIMSTSFAFGGSNVSVIVERL